MKRTSPSVRQTAGGGAAGAGAILFLATLLVLPVLALIRLDAGSNWAPIAGGWAAIALVTYLLYRSDKRRAEEGKWRIPETTLHLAELAGGWPGAYLAQRKYRHKTAKVSYQIIFWLIILVYQLVAADCLADWKILRNVALAIGIIGV